jgi:hypothetical protein
MCVFPTENVSTYSNKNPLLIPYLCQILVTKQKGSIHEFRKQHLFRSYLNSFNRYSIFVHHFKRTKYFEIKQRIYSINNAEMSNSERSEIRFPNNVLNILIRVKYSKWQFTQKNPTRCNSVSKFIIPYLYETQHVSGDTPPIIRSLKLHWQPLVSICGRLLDV